MALTILLFNSNVQYAQFYPPSNMNASWCIYFSSPVIGTRLYTYGVFAGQDTLINDTTYQIFFDRTIGPAYWHERYYVRSDGSGKGFLRFPGSLNEYLAGDLGANVGDTVRNVFVLDRLQSPNCGDQDSWKLVDFVVDSIITSTNPIGYQSTRHYVHSPCGSTIGITNQFSYWEANIGCTYGVCMVWSDLPVYIPTWIILNDTLVGGNGYPGGPWAGSPANGLCDLTVGLDAVAYQTPWEIRPNPTPGAITVELPSPLRRDTFYSVIDATGRLLFERPLPPGATTVDIDLSRFGTGTYILRITDPHGQRNERVVVE